MEDFEIVLAALFVSVAGLNVIARWLSVPYPIPLVLGGLVLGLLPGIPEIELEPDLVLLIFLPPLLYAAAFFSDLRALRSDLRAISMASIGLVLRDDRGRRRDRRTRRSGSRGRWPLRSARSSRRPIRWPPRRSCARLGAPRRLVNIIEGESLVNDATALVAYRVAVAAAVGGSFSVLDAGLEFVGAAAGGIAIGLVVGFVVAEIRRRLDDAPTEITISLLTAYAAFIPADELGLSGVLAAVTAGIYLGWRAPGADLAADAPAEHRGLGDPRLPPQRHAVHPDRAAAAGDRRGPRRLYDRRAGRLLGARLRHRDRCPLRLHVHDALRGPGAGSPARSSGSGGWARARGSSSAWAGMRGAVSLAAALALPLETDAGAPLPERDLILFITFALILVTVVGQGLTLPYLIRRLGVREDGAEEEAEEMRGAMGRRRAPPWSGSTSWPSRSGPSTTRSSASAACTSSASGASRCGPARSRTRTASRTARSPTSA